MVVSAGCVSEQQVGPQDGKQVEVLETETESVSVTDEDRAEAHAAFWEAHGEFRSGITLTGVPAGVWDMGIQPDDEDFDEAHTAHEVTLTRDYWIGTTEVTNAQWMSYMDYHPAALYMDEWMAAEELEDCPDCPVHSVSWHEMAAFSNAVSEAHGLEGCFVCDGEGADVSCELTGSPYACEGYRLATEAEWERAAWGGESFRYPGSDDIDAVGFYEDNSDMIPHPVGSKMANGYGLYDMGGNIREFVLDFQKDYPSTAQIDPFVYPDEGAYPAERGGSWACRIPELRPNRRNLKWDYARDIHSGFRLARTVAGTEVTGF
jgi:formylglycine-generating enzyme required for sulfatase activity